MLERVLSHLERLVAIDTTNPPRRIDAAHPIVTTAVDALHAAGLDAKVDDLGEGCVNIFAVRQVGDHCASTLVQCHLDTVPADPGWTRDPFTLEVTSDRAIGLGACDIKGAAAGILAALGSTTGPATVLFTTDEEAGQSRCVHAFLDAARTKTAPAAARAIESVVVAEPTGAEPVTRHRGIYSGEVDFDGAAGHASSAGARSASAVHHAVTWCARAADHDAHDLADLLVNIGVISGGTKANVAASSANVVFGFRPPPGADVDDAIDRLRALVPSGAQCRWRTRFRAPALETNPATICALLARLGRPAAPAVDFWTEAALFADAGCPAVVLGPGGIEAAHTAGESVPLDELVRAAALYATLFTAESGGHPS